MKTSFTPDLTQHPPRSPRVRLGGYAILPRMLDKGRAAIAGKNGEFHFDCPLDKRFLDFVGVDVGGVRAELEKGKSDAEILEWIEKKSSRKPSASEIVAWSAYQESRAPSDTDARKYFNEIHAKIAAHRKDVATWFELLDVDDYVTFGGKA